MSVRRAVLTLGAVVALAACAKNVPQDARTGPDGKYKGARPVVLEPGTAGAGGELSLEGESRGIVTYPGGDRVDWRLIELPADKRGSLQLELSWTAPRVGLDLSFDVYNEWGRRLDTARPRSQRRDRGKKKLTLPDARGKLYVEVYASNRGDAGKYRLQVRFDELIVEAPEVFDPSKLDVPDPPRLAAIPESCTSLGYDASNPDCIQRPPSCTPTTFNPANPRCAGVCPSPPDPALEACKAGAEKPPVEVPPEDTEVPRTEHKGKIVNVSIVDGMTAIMIDVGDKHPVVQGWTGQILDSRGKPMSGGAFVVLTTRTRQVTSKTKLKSDTVSGKNVILRAP